MNNPWFHLARKAACPSRTHLFCFPYAGGSINALRPLAEHLSPGVDVHIASLPGRASRFAERPVKQLSTLVSALADAIDQTQPERFVLYGHSMGGILGFEITRELRRRGIKLPTALVVSGVSAPDLFGRHEDQHRYNLPHDEFIEYLQTLEGTPEEFFEHPDLMEMMLPVLRADFEICDTYRYRPEPPLDVPIRALFGRDDHGVGRERMQAWSAHTRASFELSDHDGGHFFVNHQWPVIGSALKRFLMNGRR